MSRHLAGAVCLLALLVTRGSAQSASDAITGELIDTYCYAKIGVRGEPHSACAIKCVRAGIPAGLLEAKTRRVYVLLPSADATALPPSLIAAMGQQVEISGDVVAKGGASFLAVRSFRVRR
jgi:hypothetical protein